MRIDLISASQGEEREEARKMSEQFVLDIDDLDNLATPEE